MKALCAAAILVVTLVAVPSGAAHAGLAPADLAKAGVELPRGSVLDPSLNLTDIAGTRVARRHLRCAALGTHPRR